MPAGASDALADVPPVAPLWALQCCQGIEGDHGPPLTGLQLATCAAAAWIERSTLDAPAAPYHLLASKRCPAEGV